MPGHLSTLEPSLDGRATPLRLAHPPQRWWLHILLFLLTLLTTTVVGAHLAWRFQTNLPPSLDVNWLALPELLRHPSQLVLGLPFSLSLLAILLAHEFGHYFACRYYGLDASLPYFLPAPTLIGTFGATIRIRSYIDRKRVLFDVGLAGPLAGFAVLLPLLVLGLLWSRVAPGVIASGDVLFGTPYLLRVLESWFFPGTGPAHIYLHPVARAAWVGLFATALNLLPIGQLDGGHILYAIVGEKAKLLFKLFIVALIPLGRMYWPWYAWAIVLFLWGRKHPFIYDPRRLGRGRRWLGVLALVIFLVSFMPVPIHIRGL